MSCKDFNELMQWQRERMREAIDEDKWYLSEQAGNDVGSHAAATDFTQQHLPRCAVDWREVYCGTICKYRHSCELGAAMIRKHKPENEKE